MKVLIAEDEPVFRRMLEHTLNSWGYDVVVTADGLEAWKALQQEQAPELAIVDWMMPEMDGLQLCRKVQEAWGEEKVRPYLILVTAREAKEDLVAGLDAGANDYITKPFNREELRARLRVGERVVELQRSLADRVKELQEALGHVKQLQGTLPICCYCKKIRNDEKYWQQVEDYISKHSEAVFSHGVCPECWETIVQPQMEETWGCRIPYEE
jgi:sigma-B regulation protein RsbU (phosphoserine phosphatase)